METILIIQIQQANVLETTLDGLSTFQETYGKENFSMGTNNKLFNSKNSFVCGIENNNFGNLNVIFGNNNLIGNNSESNI